MPPRPKNKPLVTHARLLEIMFYDPETGEFTWRTNGGSFQPHAGKRAGYRNKHLNRILMAIDKQRYYGHRLAWFYVHGKWPVDEIDHKNGDYCDNRIANLREADSSQNKANKLRKSRNRPPISGYKGVEQGYAGRWVARICMRGVRTYLGSYDTPDEAHAAYCKAAAEIHGEFARVA
jgi:hypothetical protein